MPSSPVGQTNPAENEELVAARQSLRMHPQDSRCLKLDLRMYREPRQIFVGMPDIELAEHGSCIDRV